MMNTVDKAEISHFDRLSQQWWDENGPFKTLHQLNPVRLAYIKENVEKHIGPLPALDILDVGCGGGLISEPLTRLGANVTGIDASLENITFAQEHAQALGINITYVHSAIENMHQTFDAIMALEIIEHVTDPSAFIKHCATCVRPGGLLFLSTINRTFKAYLLAIKLAEDILNLVPRGTHQWQKFIRPKEIYKHLERHGFEILDHTGITMDFFQKTMKRSSNMDVNYMFVARKK